MSVHNERFNKKRTCQVMPLPVLNKEFELNFRKWFLLIVFTAIKYLLLSAVIGRRNGGKESSVPA